MWDPHQSNAQSPILASAGHTWWRRGGYGLGSSTPDLPHLKPDGGRGPCLCALDVETEFLLSPSHSPSAESAWGLCPPVLPPFRHQQDCPDPPPVKSCLC